MDLLRWLTVSAHVLAAAAWFGAMFYSLMVIHPRARSFFGDLGKFEEFITYIAAGARWKVLSGAGLIAVTGIVLWLWPGSANSNAAHARLLAKAVIFILAVGLFCVTSWIWWPARLLAAPEQIPNFQRRFRFVALALLVLVAVSFALSLMR